MFLSHLNQPEQVSLILFMNCDQPEIKLISIIFVIGKLMLVILEGNKKHITYFIVYLERICFF